MPAGVRLRDGLSVLASVDCVGDTICGEAEEGSGMDVADETGNSGYAVLKDG